MSELSILGRRLPKVNAWAHLTGSARYADDIRLPRMLHGRLLRATHPHALIKRIDVSRALSQLKPRDRSMLWLAYAHGWSHEEIAATLGVKTSSLKALLHRARIRLAKLLAEVRLKPDTTYEPGAATPLSARCATAAAAGCARASRCRRAARRRRRGAD